MKTKDNRPSIDDSVVRQSERFIEAARELGTDEDRERFEETVRKLASAPVTRNGLSKAKKQKPVL